MTSQLYLIPTVLAVAAEHTIPDQVKAIIQDIDIFLVENIRTARRYISSLKLGLVIEELDFKLLDKNTSYAQVNELLHSMKQGKKIGILSESGCPGVADPGSLAVAWAHKHDMEVIPLVGPSSLLLALMASGFSGQKFCFHGYLPIDKKELRNTIKRLENESRKYHQTQLFIETPYRNTQLLDIIKEIGDDNTKICIAKDITGIGQKIQTLTIRQWRKHTIDLHKIPAVFLLYAGE